MWKLNKYDPIAFYYLQCHNEGLSQYRCPKRSSSGLLCWYSELLPPFYWDGHSVCLYTIYYLLRKFWAWSFLYFSYYCPSLIELFSPPIVWSGFQSEQQLDLHPEFGPKHWRQSCIVATWKVSSKQFDNNNSNSKFIFTK